MRYYAVPFDRERVAAWIDWARTSYAAHGFGLWAVLRRSDGHFLGDCGPMLQPVEGAAVPEIGYHVVRSEQGRAARACLEWVFDHTTYGSVCSLVSPDNEPSRAVPAKVHDSMREIVWEKNRRLTCLYWTDRPALLST